MDNLSTDHKPLNGALATRRYFAKFDQIIGHLGRVTDISAEEGLVESAEAKIIKAYLRSLSDTFTALSYKYLMADRVSELLPSAMNVDRSDSGFPIYQELLQMANDAMQTDRHLQSLSESSKIKREMVNHILNDLTSPTRLQYAMSQRLYYEQLATSQLFWPNSDPQAVWIDKVGMDRRQYLLHWASYDSQLNIPTIYIMMLEDSGNRALPHDQRRWPRVQSHLMAQSVASLKLVTIAQGFDRDFDDLHPKFLRRIHIGPMYSHHFTEQSGPLREVLAEASGEAGTDWALAWTVETLQSKRVEKERSGFFGSVEREVFKLDHFAGVQEQSGASDIRRSLIMPQRPYQVLEERNPPGLKGVRKYVVGSNGKLLSYR